MLRSDVRLGVRTNGGGGLVLTSRELLAAVFWVHRETLNAVAGSLVGGPPSDRAGVSETALIMLHTFGNHNAPSFFKQTELVKRDPVPQSP